MRRSGSSSFRRRLARAAAGLAALATLASAVVAVAFWLSLRPDLPAPVLPDPAAARPALGPVVGLASVAYAADGRPLARFFRENRTWAGLDRIAPVAAQTLVAAEDHRFRTHGGVDAYRLVGAFVHTLRGDPQGASTLTMQLARNLYPSVRAAPTLRRKALEIVTAVRLERRYGKDEILEAYLNTVSFGRGAFGIEAAAQTYFGKPADALDVREAALLVGLLKGPTRYDPVRRPDRARARRGVVLAVLARRGLLAPEAARAHATAPLGLRYRPAGAGDGPAPYFAEHVRQWLERWGEAHGYDPYADGLRVYTTLDPELQSAAEHAVRAQTDLLQAVADAEWSRDGGWDLGAEPEAHVRARARPDAPPAFARYWATHPHVLQAHVRRTDRYLRLARRVGGRAASERLRADAAFTDSLRAAVGRLEAGLVALDPATGAVRAWVGGRSWETERYDHVAVARRQPGSTFKPFVYAAALERGFSPYHTAAGTVRDAAHGAPTLRDALAYSHNGTALGLTEAVGASAVARLARRLGVESPLRAVPSLALGTSEVTLLELTGAYAALAAGGVRRAPYAVTRVEDARGRVLARFEPKGEKVLSAHTAYTVVDLMRGVVDRGTGADLRARFGVDVDAAGKTGTTQHGADGWFVVAHPALVTGAWVGFNDPRVRFRSDHWGSGARTALRVAADFARRALADGAFPNPDARFRPPPGYRTPVPDDALIARGAARNDAPHAAFRDARGEGLARRTEERSPDADPEAALRRAVAARDTTATQRSGEGER